MNATSDLRCATVEQHLHESAAVKRRTAEICAGSIIEAADLIAQAFKNGGKLLLCGNGGSAADCQHMAAEFTSRLSADFVRPGLPAIALTTDTSFLTAYANDFDFDGVFARQVQALGKPGDVLLGISTSGRSTNVVRAAQMAREMGLKVIALTGDCGANDDGERRGVSPPVGFIAVEAGRAGKATRGCAQKGESREEKGERTDEESGGVPPAQKGESGRMPLLQWADVAVCIPSDNTQHIQEAHLAVEHIICHLVERAIFGDHGAGV
jgi:D-sedoheptulose 7-phosphate isomerase